MGLFTQPVKATAVESVVVRIEVPRVYKDIFPETDTILIRIDADDELPQKLGEALSNVADTFFVYGQRVGQRTALDPHGDGKGKGVAGTSLYAPGTK